ncbi:MAG: 2-deoxyglucose-6-phosphatase [Actinobacteria bacterium HGW-Actinobacteria-4]|nr:MAG: 2-deoxyglucose-6-phosphatase [Actinobacteria bacterium HGW-Actinobacteria-4]
MVDVEVRAILFDMDGTLVDSTAMVEAMWTEFAVANGVDPRDVISFAHGRPSRDTIAKFAAHASDTDHWLTTIGAWEEDRFDDVAQIPGARALVAAVPEGQWAIVTSALHGPARRRLEAVGFPSPAVLIGADDVVEGKPSPEGYLAAAAVLGVPPEQCLVFEDTEAGLAAGRAAGCTVVAVGDQATASMRVASLTEVSVEVVGQKLRVTLNRA